jgi:nucleotide-binding universal stress UspA family protein
MKTILLATDGSESSECALGFAILLAQETGASLEIISVRPQWSRGGVGTTTLEVGTGDASEHVAESAAIRAHTAGVAAKTHVLEGDTVTCIVETARGVRAELLVVGSRGRGSLSGAMLGSVSQALVHRSPIPVTIVRHTHALKATRT